MVAGQNVDGRTVEAKHISSLPTIDAIEPANAILPVHTVDTVNASDSGVTVAVRSMSVVPYPCRSPKRGMIATIEILEALCGS